MYGSVSVESASHREQQIKDVGRGRLERVFAQSSSRRSEGRQPLPKNSFIQSQPSMVGLMDDWRFRMYSVGKVYL
jgi:hypothetical protein